MEEGVGLVSGARRFVRGFRAIGNQTFACGEDLEDGQNLSSGFFGELRQRQAQDADGKGREGSGSLMAGFVSGDFDKSPDFLGLLRGSQP